MLSADKQIPERAVDGVKPNSPAGKRADGGQARTIKSQEDFRPTGYSFIMVFLSFKVPISLLNPFFFRVSSTSLSTCFPTLLACFVLLQPQR